MAITTSPSPSPIPDPIPHNIFAEEALLGAMLLTPDAVAVGIEVIKDEEYFFKSSHRIIFSAMRSLYKQGANVDLVTLSDSLAAQGTLEGIGGTVELVRIRSNSPTPSHAKDYAEIVRDNYVRRQLLSAAEGVIDMVRSSSEEDLSELIDEAEGLIYKATEERLIISTHNIKDLFTKSLAHLEDLYERGETITGTATGYKDLDELLSGLHSQNLVVVGARPSIGKTSFALGAACHIAQSQPVLFFSLEMGAEELTRRILSMLSTVKSTSLRTGRLEPNDWKNITQTMQAFGSNDLYIDDNPGLTVLEMRAKARRLKSELGSLGAIFVDYMQLMTSSEKAENRQVEVSAISRGLKILARELKCPVIALSQLSRALETRTDKHPMLADLRESGSIEQDADVVIFLYRDEVYHQNSESAGKVEVHVAKHRTGPTGYVELAWLKDITRFRNIATYSPPPEATSLESEEPI